MIPSKEAWALCLTQVLHRDKHRSRSCACSCGHVAAELEGRRMQENVLLPGNKQAWVQNQLHAGLDSCKSTLPADEAMPRGSCYLIVWVHCQ